MGVKRSYKASWLLAVWLAGSTLAPLSHYLFMAVSDVYGPAGHGAHHAAATAEPPCHGEAPVASPEPQATPPQTGAVVANVPYPHCSYHDLFATFASTAPGAEQIQIALPAVRAVDSRPAFLPDSPPQHLIRLRGPPLSIPV